MRETFDIQELIGHGGMGSVYRARDLRNDRIVALKVIHSHLADQPDFKQRFLTEIKVALAIEHPHVVPVYDVGLSDDSPYIAMKLVQGQSLHEQLLGQGSMQPSEAVQLIGQIASAVDYAHSKGIIHRDIKPANVLIDRHGDHAYLTDFGVAKALDSRTELTRTGTVIGALRYMAPEQFDDGEITPQIDIYALGCVLFELLTGTPPFKGQSDASLIREKLMDAPPSLRAIAPTVDPRFDSVLLKALARKPDARYRSASELFQAAEQILAGDVPDDAPHEALTRPIPALTKTDDETAPTKILADARSTHRNYRNPALLLAVSALVLGLGIAAATGVFSPKEAPGPTEEASAAKSAGNSASTPQSGTVAAETAPEPPDLDFEDVTARYFTAEIPMGWRQTSADEVNSGRLTNRWMSDENPEISILIDSQPRIRDISLTASARAVRSDTEQSAGYQEFGFEKTTLGTDTAVEWIFYVPGEGKKVDFFVSQCNVDLAILGVASKRNFDAYLPIFRQIAESVTARCQKLEPSSPISTEGIGSVLVGMGVKEAELAGNIA